MIQKQQAALKEMELILLGNAGNSLQIADFLLHTLFRPVLFLLRSFWWLSKPLILWSFLVVGAVFTLTFIVEKGFSYELAYGSGIFFTMNTLLIFVYFVTALVSFLALPSSYGHHGVSDEDLKAAIVLFNDNGLYENVELTGKYIEINEKSAKTRVKVWMGISGFLWTWFLFQLRLIVGTDDASTIDAILPICWGAIASLLIAAIYLKGISKLFTLAQLALASDPTNFKR